MEFLTVKEVAIIIDKTPATASRLIQTIRDAMELRRKNVTIEEFCNYLQLEKQEVKEKLHKK